MGTWLPDKEIWRFGERRFCLLGEVVRVYYRRGCRRVREGVRESGCVGFGDADGCGRDTHGSGVLSFSTNAHEWTRIMEAVSLVVASERY